MDFPTMNYRETPLGEQVWLLAQQLIEQQDQWEELPQVAIGGPLVNGMAALCRTLDHGYRSGSNSAMADAYHRAGAYAGEVEAALQDAIQLGLLEEPAAYRLDREICHLKALLGHLAIATGHGRSGGRELVETGGFG